MENEKVTVESGTESAEKIKQTIEEKIAIRMKKCANIVAMNKGDISFLNTLSASEKKVLSFLLKKCLQGQQK